MKKVLLTISRGSIARNLLKNEFYELISSSYQITILTPAFRDPRFLAEFSRPNVQFRDLEAREHTAYDRLLFFFHKHLIYNSTVNQKSHWGIIGDPRSRPTFYPLYLLKRVIFIPLSRLGFLRDFVRFVDFHTAQKADVRMFRVLLAEEKPDVVIVTNVADDMEAALIKAARREHIPTIAMPKSWDNPSKHGFRVKADMMIVWNELMAVQMTQFQNYAPGQVRKIGVPQFDNYVEKERLISREDFCALYGLDPKKKIILFSSEGKLFHSDGPVASVIYDAISEGQLTDSCQLFIRPHFGFRNDADKFASLKDKAGVAIDDFNNPSEAFRDRWDYSTEAMNRFLNMLVHADICVHTHSSIALDVIGFDKPTVSIMFDGPIQKPYRDSVARWYETYYYGQIMSFDASISVGSSEELVAALNTSLLHPEYKRTERQRLKEVFCYAFDGNAGRRFFDAVKTLLA